MLVTLDLHTNSLVLDIDPPLDVSGSQVVFLDLATRGRLIGLEIGERYIAFDDRPLGDPQLVRSEQVRVEISSNGSSVTLPRTGPGWEIAFPSGNRCWRPLPGDDGALRCEVLMPDEPRD